MRPLARHFLAGLAAGALGWLATAVPLGRLVELKVHDLFLTASCPGRAPADVVIVAVDEPSFAELGLQWPWPRRLHARLVDTLAAEGAILIGFDIVFAEPSNADDDACFAAALRAAGNVVLASTREQLSDPRFSGAMQVEPLAAFADNAPFGLATIPLDRDFVVRRMPASVPGETSFAEAVVRRLDQRPRGPAAPVAAGVQPARETAGARSPAPQPAGDRGLAFRGPPGTFTTVSYYQALDARRLLPAGFFAGKVVLVGRAAAASPDPAHGAPDVFATPFLFGGTGALMSGVEIHANIVAAQREGRFIRSPPVAFAAAVAFSFGLLGSLAQARWRPLRGALVAAALALAAGAGAYIGFARAGWWVSPVPAMIAAGAPYGVFALHAYFVSERKRREIRRAFAHYLSPAILDEVLRDPEALRLGGHKAEVTLLFSDIAGFTRISEALPPDQVSRFLNRYFTEMTAIVFAHRGTVDKFVGDALVAFWGAPVADRNHALLACRAAVAMQARLASLREEMRREGLPELHVRIGLNCGEAIVGNMGSAELFNYTALGDTVNLAARLESANKQFGTSILASRAVVDAAGPEPVSRPLGPIQVPGRAAPVDVYELQGLEP